MSKPRPSKRLGTIVMLGPWSGPAYRGKIAQVIFSQFPKPLACGPGRRVLTTIPFNMGNRQKHGLFEKNRGQNYGRRSQIAKNLGKSAILAC